MDEMVSIVVPVYNAERYLETCVRSLTDQSYTRLEIILVDDGSADKSLEICNRLAKKDERIRVFHHANHGPSYTRNFGADSARGKWLMFADADDWLEKTAVADLVAAAEQTETDLVLGGYARFDDGSDHDSGVHLLTDEYIKTLGGPECIAMLFTQASTSLAGVSVWAKLYRTDLIRAHQVRFPEGISYEEDCCFNLQYYRHIRQAVAIGHSIYHYRQTPLSLSKAYRPESFGFLLNGYRERCRFFAEFGLEAYLPALDSIMLIVMLAACKKIALSSVGYAKKLSAYRSVICRKEIQQIIRSAKKPEGKLMAAVTGAASLHCTPAVALLMYMWRKKHFPVNGREEGEVR